MVRWLVTLALAMGVAACGGVSSQFTDRGLEHVPHAYRVEARDGLQYRLMGGEWLLTNHLRNDRGWPDELPEEELVNVELDRDQDGKSDVLVKLPPADAVYEHRHSQGLVVLTSFPGTKLSGRKDVKVVAHAMVDDFNGSTAVATYGKPSEGRSGMWRARSLDFRTRLVSEHALDVDGAESHRVVFDVDQPNALEGERTSAARRIQLNLIRHPLGWPVSGATKGWTEVKSTGFVRATCEMPLYLVVLYSNRIEDFDDQAPAVDDLLRRVSLVREAEGRFPEPCEDAPPGQMR